MTRVADSPPHVKAATTARWAHIMTKWLIARVPSGTAWQLVAFSGPRNAESRGVIDLLAVRKNHRSTAAPLRRGDLLELVLIQVKGGSAAWPTESDVVRLRTVARHHRASAIVLAAWQRGAEPRLYRLKPRSRTLFQRRDVWLEVAPESIFGSPAQAS
jgi:hypothetical protein